MATGVAGKISVEKVCLNSENAVLEVRVLFTKRRPMGYRLIVYAFRNRRR